jgi:hypothetical protein
MHYKCRKCFVHHKRYFVQTVYDCPKWFRLLYENDYLAFVKTDTTFPQCDLSVRFSFGFSMHLNYNVKAPDVIQQRGAIFRFSLTDNFDPSLILKFSKYLEAL